MDRLSHKHEQRDGWSHTTILFVSSVSHQDLVPEATAPDGCLLTQPRRENNQ